MDGQEMLHARRAHRVILVLFEMRKSRHPPTSPKMADQTPGPTAQLTTRPTEMPWPPVLTKNVPK